ncbi:helix-turn-helix transcriptional regulator [Vibrio ishigakensis]|uniref:helix-turn-helix transcriptional regulator n=1 Tax=Vibrio ishigakensis TaxID=1481914 RepID=UPI0021C2A89A|nr:WYL domain-containing protein [Vibrio ishigakensis]
MAILRYIPQEPQYTTTRELSDKLSNDGFDINMRMLQRDIEILCCQHPLSCDDTVRPHRWFRIQGVNDVTFEMTPSLALAINMLSEQSHYLLPRQVHDNLKGFFLQATQKFTVAPENQLYHWPSRIANMSPGFQLCKPLIDDKVLQVVERALIQQTPLEISYRPRPPRYSKKYQINPLGLVTRGPVYYLIATLRESGDYRHFVLHRIQDVELITTVQHRVQNFNLSTYIKNGNLSFPKDNEITLELKVSYIEGYHLLETTIHPEQEISYPDPHHFVVKAKVNHTEELKWWLMSLSDISEVIGPNFLRRELTESLEKAVRQYQSN